MPPWPQLQVRGAGGEAAAAEAAAAAARRLQGPVAAPLPTSLLWRQLQGPVAAPLPTLSNALATKAPGAACLCCALTSAGVTAESSGAPGAQQWAAGLLGFNVQHIV